MTETTPPDQAVPSQSGPAPSVKDIGAAFMRTIFESLDSKKSMTGLVSAIAAVLSLIAGKQGWAWLDPPTSQMIAGVIVAKAAVVIASHAVVDKAKAQAAAPTGTAS